MLDAITPADWFAVQTRYRFEKKVASQLEQKGCQVYLPLLCESHAWSDRQKVVTVPLFPGYAFVYIDQSRDSRRRVLETSGLIGFVHFGGSTVPVPRKQIDDLQSLQRENARFGLHPFIKAGQRVRVRGGCLNGLEGVLLEQNKNKMVISIDAIQRSIAVEVCGYELELA
jgi:transcription antitermination factor NusG